MIRHLVELWFGLALTFAAGCVIGVLLRGWHERRRKETPPEADRFGDVPMLPLAERIEPVLLPSSPAVADQQVEESLPDDAEPPRPEAEIWPPPEDEPRSAADEGSWVPAGPPVRRLPAPPPVADDPRASEPAVANERDAEEPVDVAPQPPLPAGGADIETEEHRAGTAGEAGASGVLPPDDLTRITGIGARSAEKLRRLGVTRFAEIAAWSSAEIAQFAAVLKAGPRIARQDWVGQARVLAGRSPSADSAEGRNQPAAATRSTKAATRSARGPRRSGG